MPHQVMVMMWSFQLYCCLPHGQLGSKLDGPYLAANQAAKVSDVLTGGKCKNYGSKL